MTVPKPYGIFHLVFFALSIIIAIILCATQKNGDDKRVRRVVFITAVIVTVLEIYKQINYSFSYGDAIKFDYQWYAFPWQFCSMPMYVGLLTGLFRRGRVHNALCAFLATYSIFAGICVMIYPNDVFTGAIGINIQTMICHGSMITVGIYLLYTEYVKLSHKTILGAMSVFASAVTLAVIFNEIVYHSGIAGGETFNMFFVSPHFEPSLPVYSSVQAVVAYPWCLIIYIAAFSAAAYAILLLAMLVKKIYLAIRNKKAEI
jgi:hypothetical protein